MKIIDAHLHFWDLNNNLNSWVSKQTENPDLNKNYLPNELTQNFINDLYGVVHVEAHDLAISTISEVKWLELIMKENQSLKYYHIAFADITLPSIEFGKMIDQLSKYESVVGIRHILSFNPKFKYNPCLEDLSQNFNIPANLNYLAKNNLIFNCQMYPYQINAILPAIIKSGVTCIIDHLALPAWLKEGDFEHQLWQRLILKLAQIENISIKVSGLDMLQKKANFNSIIKFCFDNVPFNKLMYGSNYPVSFTSDCNFWYNYLNSLSLSHTEKKQLFFKNAFRTFFKKLI